jgi:hypothetical protein
VLKFAGEFSTDEALAGRHYIGFCDLMRFFWGDVRTHRGKKLARSRHARI